MATSRVLSTEDGNLSSGSIITSRTKDYSDVDLSFVPKPNGDIFKKTDAAAVKQSVKNIILTNHFEKPFLPFFGGNVRALLFELAYDDVGEETQENIISALERYEPRARVLNIDVQVEQDNNNLRVTIEFQVVSTEEIVIFTTVVSRLR